MWRQRATGPAPSISAASISSSGTWVSAAYTVNATNGTLIHTTITVATKKKDSGWSSQAWPSKSRPSPVST